MPLQLPRTFLSFCLAIAFFLGVATGVQAQSPVILAVDTSRSLDLAALSSASGSLSQALSSLDASTPTGLLAFDDSPTWVAGPGATPADVASALETLRPQGNFTLLNDALFVATRELPDGGIILLVSDGRDENSAVSVDDIARRCEAQGIRIVSIGTGQQIAERSLRRLAMVSEGAYLGRLDQTSAADIEQQVQAQVERTQLEVTERQAAQALVSTSTPNTSGTENPEPAAVRPPVDESAGDAKRVPWWQSPWPWLGLVALGFWLVFLWRLLANRSTAGAVTHQEEDDHAETDAADEAEAGMFRQELVKVEAAGPQQAPEVTVDTKVFDQMSLDERLDRTQVLSNQGILVVRRNGERARTFMLDSAKAFSIGRDRLKSTLGIPDPALSAVHFKVVPREGAFYFVDLESTNGSYINGRRINAKRLRHGDRIRAGQVEMEFQSYGNR